MKSYAFATLLLLASLLVAGTAAAAVTLTSPTLGGANQERGVSVTSTFTISDSAITADTPVTVTLTSNSGYSVTFDDNTTSKTYTIPNATKSVTATVKATVPLSHSAVDADLNPVIPQVATITAGSVTQAVKMQAINHLALDKVNIYVNGDSKRVDDGDKVDGLKIGDTLDIEVTAENGFSGNDPYDTEIQDTKISVKADDKDLDIDDDDNVDIGADDSEVVTFDNYEISEDVSDKTYNLDIKADGTDENGARHGEAMTVKLKVERDSHEVVIKSASLSRSTVDCNNPTTDMTVRVANIGKNDESASAIIVQNSALGINSKISGLQIDEDESMTRTFSGLAPKTDKPGSYVLDVISYFANTVESHREQVTLTVATCPTTPTTTTTGNGGSTVVVTPTGTTTTGTTTGTTVTTGTGSTGTTGTTGTTTTGASVPKPRVTSTDNDYSVPLLVGGVVIAVVLLIVLVMLLVRPRVA